MSSWRCVFTILGEQRIAESVALREAIETELSFYLNNEK